MRTTFVISANRELVSAVRPRMEPHALSVGTRIVLSQPYATDWGFVPKGAKGFVDHLHEADGTVEVLMEGIEPALFHWNNTLVLSPYTCEDLVACVKLPVDKKLPKAKVSVPQEGTDHASPPNCC
jgi:hypothetical protein